MPARCRARLSMPPTSPSTSLSADMLSTASSSSAATAPSADFSSATRSRIRILAVSTSSTSAGTRLARASRSGTSTMRYSIRSAATVSGSSSSSVLRSPDRHASSRFTGSRDRADATSGRGPPCRGWSWIGCARNHPLPGGHRPPGSFVPSLSRSSVLRHAETRSSHDVQPAQPQLPQGDRLRAAGAAVPAAALRGA